VHHRTDETLRADKGLVSTGGRVATGPLPAVPGTSGNGDDHTYARTLLGTIRDHSTDERDRPRHLR
jgi:hypothetical protein